MGAYLLHLNQKRPPNEAYVLSNRLSTLQLLLSQVSMIGNHMAAKTADRHKIADIRHIKKNTNIQSCRARFRARQLIQI